jgi:hypothetical protein
MNKSINYPLQALSEYTVNEMNQREYESPHAVYRDEVEGLFSDDLDALDIYASKIFDQMDIDKLNDGYLTWMESFEGHATVSEGYPVDMDVNYQIVDTLFDEGFKPMDAVREYWNR